MDLEHGMIGYHVFYCIASWHGSQLLKIFNSIKMFIAQHKTLTSKICLKPWDGAVVHYFLDREVLRSGVIPVSIQIS